MEPIPAPGSPEMQNALKHHNVHTIVDILLQVIDQDYFKVVALFLRNNDQGTSPSFSQKLQSLRNLYKSRPNAEGRITAPPYIDELISTLEVLYKQTDVTVGFQRGAIVELLASKLVCPRCKESECLSNHLFRYKRGESNQVDVVVFSQHRQQIEGYTCKMKSNGLNGLKSTDCTNLTQLASKAQEEDFDVHIGVICFDRSLAIEKQIRYLLMDMPVTVPIHAYGIDNIRDLGKSPF